MSETEDVRERQRTGEREDEIEDVRERHKTREREEKRKRKREIIIKENK